MQVLASAGTHHVGRPVANEGLRRDLSAGGGHHVDVLVVHAAHVHACAQEGSELLSHSAHIQQLLTPSSARSQHQRSKHHT